MIVIQRYVVYLYHIRKLKKTFSGSAYALNAYIITLLYALLTVIVICGLSVLYWYTYNETNITCQSNAIPYIIVTFGVLDIFFACLLTKLFTSKLECILKIKMVAAIHFVIVKLKKLCCISVISSILFIIVAGLNGYIKPYTFYGIDIIINNIILILSFGKSNEIYIRICCCLVPSKKNMGLRQLQSASQYENKDDSKDDSNNTSNTSTNDGNYPRHKTQTKTVPLKDGPNHTHNQTQSITFREDTISTTAAAHDLIIDIVPDNDRPSQLSSHNKGTDSIANFVKRMSTMDFNMSIGDIVINPTERQSVSTVNETDTNNNDGRISIKVTEDMNSTFDLNILNTPNLCRNNLKELGIIL